MTSVPIAELEQLVDEQMDDASKQYDDAHSGYERGMGHGRIEAYSKIKALIVEHKDD